MTTGSSGAVFFLGTRAHYQILQQPETRCDAENGNTSTENIYQNNASTETIYQNNASTDTIYRNDASTETIYHNPAVQPWNGHDDNWRCDDAAEDREQQESTGVKRRGKRHSSESTLCERDEMRPALLNQMANTETPKSKPARRHINLLAFLAGLARRKPKFDTEQIHYLRHIESALTACTYRESCRCLECQSRYFDCDESEDDYSSEDDYKDYTPRYAMPPPAVQTTQPQPPSDEDEDDDEVFVDRAPGDNTSTDMLIDGREVNPVTKMSISSDDCTETDDNDALELEVAAGTPVLLNYLLTHPITCAIQ